MASRLRVSSFGPNSIPPLIYVIEFSEKRFLLFLRGKRCVLRTSSGTPSSATDGSVLPLAWTPALQLIINLLGIYIRIVYLFFIYLFLKKWQNGPSKASVF